MALFEARIERSGYGHVTVLRDVAVSVETGELVVVIGGNGAGKTTLLRTISGMSVRARSEISLDGERLDAVPAYRRVAKGIVHVPEARHVFGQLTVLENLRMGMLIRKPSRAEWEESLGRVGELFPILTQRARQQAGSLSGGEQQMLAIARGLMSKPRLLMVDEASLGLAPLVVDAVFDALATVCANGTAVLLVEQNTRSSLEIAKRGYVLDQGRVVLSGDAARLLDDPRVAAAYLGDEVA